MPIDSVVRSSYISRLLRFSQQATIFPTREPIRIGDRVKPARTRFRKGVAHIIARHLAASLRRRPLTTFCSSPRCGRDLTRTVQPRTSWLEPLSESASLATARRAELRRQGLRWRVPLSPRLGACARDGVLVTVNIESVADCVGTSSGHPVPAQKATPLFISALAVPRHRPSRHSEVSCA